MMNAGNKKLRLVLLALALFACSVMALGGTLANEQFMPEGTPTSPPSGKTFDVTVKYHNGTNYQLDLLQKNSVFTENVPWCPGYTKIVYLKVTNNEKFPVQCTLTLTAGESKLNNVMNYVVLEDIGPESENRPTSWANITDKKHPLTVNSHDIFKDVVLKQSASNTYALAIHMDENANNDYQGKSMNLAFKLTVNANYAPGTIELTNPQ